MNGDAVLEIDIVEKYLVGNIFIVRCISKRPRRNYISNLDIITQQLGVIYPTAALKLADLYP